MRVATVFTLLLVITLFGCGGGGYSAPPAPPPPTPTPSGDYNGIDSSAPYAVKTTSGIVFGAANINTMTPRSFDLLLNFYEPDVDLTGYSLPMMIIILGCAFSFGSGTQRHLVTFAASFASQGYLAVSIDYRVDGQDPVLSPEMRTLESEISPFPLKIAMLAAAEDTVSAVRWMIDNAVTYHIDTDRIGLLGASAGAITALNVEYALAGYGFDLPAFQVVVICGVVWAWAMTHRW